MLNAGHKPLVSPFVAVTYAVVAITGLLMIFHVKVQALHQVHQLGGVLFIAGGGIHLLLNRKILLSYYNRSKAILGTLAGVLIIVLLVAMFPHKEDGERYHNRGKGKGFYSNTFRR